MVRCAECIHFETCKDWAIDCFHGNTSFPYKAETKEELCEHYKPTADVAPKSEVERLTVELDAMRGAANTYKMHYENARKEIERLKDYNTGVAFKDYFDGRKEVAREICCEIEEEIVAALKSNYEALKTHDDGRCNDYILELVGRIKGKIDALRGIENFVEEIKNKYTEDKG